MCLETELMTAELSINDLKSNIDNLREALSSIELDPDNFEDSYDQMLNECYDSIFCFWILFMEQYDMLKIIYRQMHIDGARHGIQYRIIGRIEDMEDEIEDLEIELADLEQQRLDLIEAIDRIKSMPIPKA